ncbi:MAG: polysaccharide deacetylase [Lachnospiraceae bacterium]|nr:polysaccharide deacetylase [Lachnospiraceae bacterium]
MQLTEILGVLDSRVGYGYVPNPTPQPKQDEMNADPTLDTTSDNTTDSNPTQIQDVIATQDTEAAHKVYLTFDDGPSAYTEEILDILDEYNVKATFFVVGKEDEDSKERLREIVNRGHSVGMHSYSHVYDDLYQSVEAFGADLMKIKNYIFETTGVECNIYRFPGGSSNTVSDIDVREFIRYLNEQGIRYFDWNIASGDASTGQLNVGTIVENATYSIESYSTAIILMHDAYSKHHTVEALPLIIENILAYEDTVILPITQDTTPIQHIQIQ